MLDSGFLQKVDDTWKGYKKWNDEIFYPNKLTEYPGLSSLNKKIKFQDPSKFAHLIPPLKHLNAHNFPGGTTVSALQFAENTDYNFQWQYAITKKVNAPYYISDKNMTWSEANNWSKTIN